ncbi:uncharacterized protein [Typha angustifolia]|uniref:uncharacterized protein n=1 Tax=Typha angustifolia TaxID=59011 RepID=UPI003C2BAB69
MDSKSSPADQARDAAVEEKEVVNQEVTDKDAITKLDTAEVTETVVTKSEQNLEDKFVVEVMTAPEENSKAPDSEVHAVNGVKEEINISTPPEPTPKIITDDESKNTEKISGAIEAQNEEVSEIPAVPTPASETETKLEELPSAYTENRSTETFNGKELVVEDKASFDALKEDNSPSKIEDENKKVEEAVAIESSKETVADAAECKAVEEIPVADSVDAPKEVDKVEEPVKEVPTGDVISDPSATAGLSEVTDITPVTGTAKENGNPEHTIEEEKQENSMKDEEPILITEDKINASAVGLQVPEVPSEEVKASEDAVLVEEKKDENLGGLDIAAASNEDEKTPEGAEPFKETKDDETTLDASAIVVEASTVEEKTSEGSEVVERKDESLNDEKTAKASEEAVQDLEKKDENLESQEEISATADASIAVVESLTGQEKTSECTEIVKEIKDESSKDDHEKISVKASEEAVSEGQEEISKNLDAHTIVAEVSNGEKTSESTEIVKETKDESSKDDETTLDASAIVVEASAEEGKIYESSEIVETKDESLNDEKTTKASEEAVSEGQEEISRNLDAPTIVAEVPNGEKTSESTEIVKETKDESSKDDETTLDASAIVVEASAEEGKIYESSEIVETKDESLNDEKTTKASEEAVSEGQEEISRNLDAPTIVAEVPNGEKTSESTEIVKETKDESSKDDETTLDASAIVIEASAEEVKNCESSDIVETKDESLNDEETTKASEEAVSEGQEEISRNLDAPTIVAEVSNGEKTSESTEIVKETKDESSKDDETTLDASAIVIEASAEEVKICESSDIVETKASEEAVMDLEKKDEKLEGLEEISKNPDASSSVEVESSPGEEKISECTESVKEIKDESSKDEEATSVKASEEAVLLGEKKDDEHVEGQEEISKNLDAPTNVAEISTGGKEKTSESSEIVKETTDEISKDAKTTLVDASAVDTATEVAKISSEEKKDSEDHSTTLDITANDSDVAPAAEVAPQEEKISEGDELVDVKKNNEAKTSECAELDDGNKVDTLDPVEIAKEVDVKERNTPAAFLESTDGAEGAEKHKEAVEDNEETEKLIETNSVEPSKDSDVAKKDRETAAKQDAPVKPSQRHSNNIISKVKHSIVKVKKAIIGKSPSSKTMSAGDKNDIKVK